MIFKTTIKILLPRFTTAVRRGGANSFIFLTTGTPDQESPADAKVSARQQRMYEGP